MLVGMLGCRRRRAAGRPLASRSAARRPRAAAAGSPQEAAVPQHAAAAARTRLVVNLHHAQPQQKLLARRAPDGAEHLGDRVRHDARRLVAAHHCVRLARAGHAVCGRAGRRRAGGGPRQQQAGMRAQQEAGSSSASKHPADNRQQQQAASSRQAAPPRTGKDGAVDAVHGRLDNGASDCLVHLHSLFGGHDRMSLVQYWWPLQLHKLPLQHIGDLLAGAAPLPVAGVSFQYGTV